MQRRVSRRTHSTRITGTRHSAVGTRGQTTVSVCSRGVSIVVINTVGFNELPRLDDSCDTWLSGAISNIQVPLERTVVLTGS